MGQMLRALKNLEARGSLSPRSRSGTPHLAEQAAESAFGAVGGNAASMNDLGDALLPSTRPRRQSPPVAVLPPPTAALMAANTVVDVAWTNPFLGTGQIASPATFPIVQPAIAPPAPIEAAVAQPTVAHTETVEPAIAPPAVVAAPREQESEPPAVPARPAANRAAAAAPRRVTARLASLTAAERLVARAINDPIRGQSLIRLAERLHRDLEQTASKTVLFAGIGPESTTHETLLHIAPLLTERCRGNVLLVDADLARRALTGAMERERQPGLGELLRGNESARDFCQPTATDRLHFLPAGLALKMDMPSASARLEQLLEELSESFDCVLIDGGRTPDRATIALGPLADATYLVVQLGEVETNTAEAALRELRAQGARVLGSIAT